MARIAKSLSILRDEVNALAPDRVKTRDGWIGDAEHASRASRHNPNAEGVVCALDITNDPAHGCDIHLLARTLVARLRAGGTTNPDFEYVISNGKVASRKSNWEWEDYHGVDPHDLHAHFAVGRGPDSAPTTPYDDTIPWNIANLVQEDDMYSNEDRARDDAAAYAVVSLILPAVGRLEVKAQSNPGGPITAEDIKAIQDAIKPAVKAAFREGTG